MSFKYTGCGAHIHEGTSCTDPNTQLGHYYNTATLSSDPWALAGYRSTDGLGNGYFADCLETGVSDFDGRAFIVHSKTGSRVSCGLLGPTPESSDDDGDDSSDNSGEDAPTDGGIFGFVGAGFEFVGSSFAAVFQFLFGWLAFFFPPASDP